MAWNPEAWPKERIAEFTRLFAEREFGPEHAGEIAEVIAKYTKYNGRRKPELLDESTFSLVNYQEADRMLADWKSLAQQAEEIGRALPEEAHDAFYELVLHPVKACAVVNDLYISAAKSRLYASQGRASANDLAAQARALFQTDAALSSYFNHTLARGKWDHMMDQTHIGYTYWQQPPSNTMPMVGEIELPSGAALGVAVEGSTNAWPGSPAEAKLPQYDVFTQARHYVDVFNRGQAPFAFTASASEPWIELDLTNGTVQKEQRLWVSVDWSKAPEGLAAGHVMIHGPGADLVDVVVASFHPAQQVTGFVESAGCISIEAEHYTKKTDTAGARWERIEDYGRTLSSMTIFPVTAASVTPPRESPCLEYQCYVFEAGPVEVEAILAPTLNFVPGRGLRYGLSFDNDPPEMVDVLARHSERDWETAVADGARKVKTSFRLAAPGPHVLKFWMVDSGVVLQKLVVDLGGVKPSYLGPPESYMDGHE
jgi:hypothetical protein